MSLSKDLRLYLQEAAALRNGGVSGCSVWELLRSFSDWRRSLAPASSPLQDRRPWLTFAATRFLKRQLTPQMRIFEYGSGGSTLFFADRVDKVVSVEHDPQWAAKVQATLAAEKRDNTTVHLVPPQPDPSCAQMDPADPAACISSAGCFRGMSFGTYVASLDCWPDGFFDLVMVDGRARPACVHHAIPKVRPKGWLLLDDAERAHYQPALGRLNELSWPKRDFSGPGPYVAPFRRTWIWQRPGSCEQTLRAQEARPPGFIQGRACHR